MCITVAAMNEKMAEIQSLKRLREETEDAIKALEAEVINFLMKQSKSPSRAGETGRRKWR